MRLGRERGLVAAPVRARYIRLEMTGEEDDDAGFGAENESGAKLPR